MNRERIGITWKQAKGEIQDHWAKLNNDQLEMVSGNRNQLIVRIQECYGVARDDAEKQVKEWESKTRICLFETVQRRMDLTTEAQY